MLNSLQILTLVVVAFTMVPASAHALELPGKMRLSKDLYFAVQRIYYPGFTFAGFGGPASILLTVTLLFYLPVKSEEFWLTMIALCGVASMEIIYWILIHPVNKVWVQNLPLSGAASGFFGVGRRDLRNGDRILDWTELRNRWEYAHAARAVLAFLSFLALVIGRGYGPL